MNKKRHLKILPQLHRAIHQLGLFIAAPEGIDVTQAEAIILAFLSDHQRATMSELHRAFGHKRSTLTSVVDRLAARGLVNRKVSSGDRRSFVVSLSRKGSAVARRLHRRLAGLEAAALKGVSDRDLAKFLELLARLGTGKQYA